MYKDRENPFEITIFASNTDGVEIVVSKEEEGEEEEEEDSMLFFF
jgi:hypothetical protein